MGIKWTNLKTVSGKRSANADFIIAAYKLALILALSAEFSANIVH